MKPTTILSIVSHHRLELKFGDGLMDKQILIFNNIDIYYLNPYNYKVTLEYMFRNSKDVFHTDVSNMERYVSMFSELVGMPGGNLEVHKYKAYTEIELLDNKYTLLGVSPREFRLSDTSAQLDLHVDCIIDKKCTL